MGQIEFPGHPQLPVAAPKYIVPYWEDIAYCEIVDVDSVQLPGSYKIFPAQKPVIIGDTPTWTPPDSAIYNSDALYPSAPLLGVESGVFDGARIVSPKICIFRYRPKSGKLFVYTKVVLRLHLKNAETPIRAFKRYKHIQEIYDKILKDLVDNPEMIPAWYQRPQIIDINNSKNTLYPAYIIITTARQSSNSYLQEYVDWMWDRGYPTSVYSIEDILSFYPGYDDAEKLRNFIIDKYQNWGTAFFLFLGHEDDIPFRYICLANNPSDPHWGIAPSDLYFSSLNGTWDEDGDHKYGEPNDDAEEYDFYPEVFVGRVLAKTPIFGPPGALDEVQNWIEKVLIYEKSPGNASGLTHVFYSVFRDSSEDFTGYASSIADAYPSSFTHTFYVGQTPEATRDYINAYPLGWVQIVAHGEAPWWCPKSKWAYFFWGPEFWDGQPRTPNLNELTNENKYPLVYDMACNNAAFDDLEDNNPTDTTVVEGWLEAYRSKGAAAVIGNTREAYTLSYRLDAIFVDLTYNEEYYLIGVAHALSKPEYPFYRRDPIVANLFGSPLTEAWSAVPKSTHVAASPNSIPVGQSSTVTVTYTYFDGETNRPVSDARVVLRGCGVYRVGYTNAQGQAVFEVFPSEEGQIVATATKHDYLPAQTVINVSGKSGARRTIRDLPATLNMTTSTLAGGKLGVNLGIPSGGVYEVCLYDAQGRLVRKLFEGELAPGWHRMSFNLSVRRGVYFIRLQGKGLAITRRLVR